MSLQIASLNSGSNGNCYYVGNETDAVLIDAGISCREIEKRMKHLSLDIKKLRAVFISHEHSDHIRGLATLVKRHFLPVYITHATAKRLPDDIRDFSRSFTTNVLVEVLGLQIMPFLKKHDADDPHSFVISYDGIKVGVITDIGCACEQVVHYFRQCHAVFLESNYDEDMLANGRYPSFLKQRICSDTGHLSNRQAFELFTHHRPHFMTHILLSHLSKDNNNPDLALELFRSASCTTQIQVAGRYGCSELLWVTSEERNDLLPYRQMHFPIQMKLFESDNSIFNRK